MKQKVSFLFGTTKGLSLFLHTLILEYEGQIDQKNYVTMLFMSKQVALPKISPISQKVKIGQKPGPVYLFARRPSIINDNLFFSLKKSLFLLNRCNNYRKVQFLTVQKMQPLTKNSHIKKYMYYVLKSLNEQGKCVQSGDERFISCKSNAFGRLFHNKKRTKSCKLDLCRPFLLLIRIKIFFLVMLQKSCKK